jgi:hypothetical protein
MAIFSGKGLLNATVHEISDMGILFRFRRAELAESLLGYNLTQQTIKGFRREGHVDRQPLLILGKRHHMQGGDDLPFKATEFGHHQSPDQLAYTIGTEVEADEAIARTNLAILQTDRFKEFIGDLLGIGINQDLLGCSLI